MMKAEKPEVRFRIHHEVLVCHGGFGGSLWLQYGFHEDLPSTKNRHGFRFVWRGKDHRLHADRGPARIPSLKLAQAAMDEAIKQDWGCAESLSLSARSAPVWVMRVGELGERAVSE